MATYNETDLQQTPENLARVRRDRLTGPGVQPSGFVDLGGDTSAVPGDQAPYSRLPPFATPFQQYGVETRLGIEAANPFYFPGSWPVLDVEGWRKATFVVSYYVDGPPNTVGQLGWMPFYGVLQAGATLNPAKDNRVLVPKLILDPISFTAYGDKGYAYQNGFAQEFRSPPGLSPFSIIPFNFTFTLDVAEFCALTLDFKELSEAVTCDPEAEQPVCSVLNALYSLSM